LLTEEAAKSALTMPFLQSLGYDVFNPGEVVPEFTADVVIKKVRKLITQSVVRGKYRCSLSESLLDDNNRKTTARVHFNGLT
jgi:hypothetical protein